MDLAVGTDAGSEDDEATTFETLQATVEGIIEERVQMLLGSLGLETNEGETGEAGAAATGPKNEPDPDDLARKVFPYLKRLIAIERERKIGW
jgi:hypothetical protein